MSIKLYLLISFLVFSECSFKERDSSKSNIIKFASVENNNVYRCKDNNVFFFEAGLRVDADGSPRAYHPEDLGMDFLRNAGRRGNWWALATWPNGEPYVQQEKDLFPGYYVSKTSLEDTSFHPFDPNRYVNAEEIPYIVLPEKLIQKGGARLGDFVAVVNKHNNQITYGIFADVGPAQKLGEASIALAEQLGLYANPKDGGIENGIIYVVFPRSGNGKSRTIDEINTESFRLLKAWGGEEKIKKLFKITIQLEDPTGSNSSKIDEGENAEDVSLSD